MTEKVSLTELQLIIRDSLYLALPDFYWVIAEISELKENNAGHCYLELIEKQADDKNVRARVKAIIWANRYRFIKAFFRDSTGETLREGLKVLVKIKIEYHELYGLSLIISDIDPAFTLGEMALKRQLIINKLEQEGVFSMNKELTFPIVPQRIAVISSKNAAGYTDFMNHLKSNSYGYVFYTALIEASLQGTETEQGIINALDRIALNLDLFDLVVIIRGGGSQSDLSWFDNYNIAYHITQFPLPVITGIGHEKDVSVTDMVAHLALKTPTAVADFIIDSIYAADNHILNMCSDIIDASRNVLEKNRNRIETSAIKLSPLVRVLLSEIKEQLSSLLLEINNKGKNRLSMAALISANQRSRLSSAAKSFISANVTSLEKNIQKLVTNCLTFLTENKNGVNYMENKLELLNPENILKRGYSITTLDGKCVKDSTQIKEGDMIDTQLLKGSLRSKVLNRTINDK